MLFLHDVRGSVPLSYVTKKNWGLWNYFLMTMVLDEIFPAVATPNTSSSNNDEIAATDTTTPLLCTLEPDSRPVPDPVDALSPHVAKQVANGEIEPDDAFSTDVGEKNHDSFMTRSDGDTTCALLTCEDESVVPNTATLRKQLQQQLQV